jgi:bidirectional [NiFe] hydrogenase diaphorase subunit
MPTKKIQLRIDGEMLHAEEGESILKVARRAGKYIPTLCHLDGLTDVGACRLCLVEVSGVGRLLPACTTPVQDGMSVTTASPKLARYRRMNLELLFSERNHVCSVCVSNGHCELQSMAKTLGVTSVRYGYGFPKLSIDMSHERYVLDHNRCILCTRCVRVCAEVEGAHVWNLTSRGVHARVICDLDQPWGEAKGCTACGKCVQSCPTGALAEKGYAVEEMVKRNDNISALAVRRGGQ